MYNIAFFFERSFVWVLNLAMSIPTRVIEHMYINMITYSNKCPLYVV